MTSFPTTARPRHGQPASESPLIDRLPPHDLSAEAGVLGSIIIDPKTLPAVREFLRSPAAFFKEENQIIFRIFCELSDKRNPIDGMILCSTLETQHLLDQVGGKEYIRQLVGAVPTSAHAEYYAAIVKEKAMLRALITACTSTLHDCYEGDDHPVAIQEKMFTKLVNVADIKQSDLPSPMSELIPELMTQLEDPEQRKKLQGIQTGFLEIDNATGGLLNGDMIVIAARPSVGKTAFALNMLEYIGICLDKTVAMFSLEMKKQQMAMRALSSQSGIDSHRLKSGNLTEEEWRKLAQVSPVVASPKIFIDDTVGLSLNELRKKALWLKNHHNVEVLAVDYLGLMKAEKAENRTEQLRVLSAGIKNLARELDIPILCLSQLNRESEKDQRPPRVSDIRGSGDIEQDADVIMLLHREAVMHRGDHEWINANPDKISEAQVEIAKQRNYPCCVVKLTYLDVITRFVNYKPGI